MRCQRCNYREATHTVEVEDVVSLQCGPCASIVPHLVASFSLNGSIRLIPK